MSLNVKVRDIAEYLVLTGELPLVRTGPRRPARHATGQPGDQPSLRRLLSSRGSHPGGVPR
jgi:hypothetical protein